MANKYRLKFNLSDGSQITAGEFEAPRGAKGAKGDTGSQGAKGDKGDTGSRGTSILNVTTAPSSYTTATGGFTPKYRIALSTVKSQSGATSVIVGDSLRYSFYLYPVGYVDSSYVYCGTRVSIRGASGTNGTDGVTPVKGVDYFTEAEKETMKSEVAQEVIAAFNGLPLFGVVEKNNVVTITSLLSDGTYTLKYENSDGSTSEIGSITVGDGTGGGSGGSEEPTVYEIDIDSVGYTDNARWSTSQGTLRTPAEGYTAINLIPFTRASGQTMTITLSGNTWVQLLEGNAAHILFYVGEYYEEGYNLPLKDLPQALSDKGITGEQNADGDVIITVTDNPSGLMFDGFKVCGTGNGANAIISYTIQ